MTAITATTRRISTKLKPTREPGTLEGIRLLGEIFMYVKNLKPQRTQVKRKSCPPPLRPDVRRAPANRGPDSSVTRMRVYTPLVEPERDRIRSVGHCDTGGERNWRYAASVSERSQLIRHLLELSSVITCLSCLRCLARAGDVRNRDSRNDGDNRDDNEKFDQAERRVEPCFE